MTRKDYERIASIIATNRALVTIEPPTAGNAIDNATLTGYVVALNDTALAMADMLAQDNPRFDRARFLKACGL